MNSCQYGLFADSAIRHLLAALFFWCVAGTSVAEDSIPAMLGDTHATVDEQVTVDPEMLVQLQSIARARIVLHALEQQSQLASQISRLLAALGAEQVEQRLVSQSPEDQEVRYFHSTDRSAAILVHGALALVFTGIEVRDFTHFTPSPHQKLIEVWL